MYLFVLWPWKKASASVSAGTVINNVKATTTKIITEALLRVSKATCSDRRRPADGVEPRSAVSAATAAHYTDGVPLFVLCNENGFL